MENEKKPVRAFIAVELPDDIKERIASLAGELDIAGIPVKPVRRENLHITLKFLGQSPPEELEKAKAACSACAEGAKPFPLALRGVGAFPSAERPSVLWAGAHDETGSLASLAKELQWRLLETGREKEQRIFHPHATAARIKKSIKSAERKIIRQWLEENRDADFGLIEVRRLSLLASRLSSEGPSYSLLAGFDFPDRRRA